MTNETLVRVGLGWVGLGWVGLGWVGLGWVEVRAWIKICIRHTENTELLPALAKAVVTWPYFSIYFKNL